MPAGALCELQHEQVRLRLVEEQIKELEQAQSDRLRNPETDGEKKACKLMKLRGVGPVGSWTLGQEFFGWRRFKNRRQVGALAGLTGTPYDSGESVRDQGISKAGNPRVRYIMVELAWNWLLFQPQSELSRWFDHRFGHGSKRMRRVGIVALARKLLVALWKYVDHDELPTGAVLSNA